MIKMFCYLMIFYFWVTSIFTFEMLQLILKFWCRWTPSSTWSLKKQGAFIRYRWDISPVRLTMVEIFGIFVKKFPIFRWVVTAGSSWSHSGQRLHLHFLFFHCSRSAHRGSAEAIPVNACIYIFCLLCSAFINMVLFMLI